MADLWVRRRVMQETPHEFVEHSDRQVPWCAVCSLHRDARCHQPQPIEEPMR